MESQEFDLYSYVSAKLYFPDKPPSAEDRDAFKRTADETFKRMGVEFPITRIRLQETWRGGDYGLELGARTIGPRVQGGV